MMDSAGSSAEILITRLASVIVLVRSLCNIIVG